MPYWLIPILGSLSCVILGIYVLIRNPRGGTNRYFAFGMAGFSLSEFGIFLAGSVHTGIDPMLSRKIVTAGEILLPVPWLLFGLNIVQLTHFSSQAWKRNAVAAASLVSIFSFVFLVLQAPLPSFVSVDRIDHWFSVFFILTTTVALASFESALRNADHVQRWRIKFLLLGVSAMLVARIYVHSQHLLFPSKEIEPTIAVSIIGIIGVGLIAFSLVRHQLLDVNVFVSRYFIYNSFTVVAVGTYLLIVGLSAQAIRSFGGTFGDSAGIVFGFVAVLLLLLILLSTRARKTFRIFINRHFYRNRYDYHKEWLTLTEKLSDRLYEKDLLLPVVELLRETMWVENVQLWLCDEEETVFHSVALSDRTGTGEITFESNSRVVNALKVRGYPVTLEGMKEIIGPEAFADFGLIMKERGVSVLVPLITRERLVGVLGCGKSRSGHPFDREDFDLMNTVARQAANSFLIARLSERLVHAKELETFHTFSAFVLHDLKNFVSMLSLVVQNADRNLDNPEFRRDAIKNIANTVEKMKRMMDSLSVLSREPELHAEMVDLRNLVQEVAIETKGSLRSRVVEELSGPLPVVADAAAVRTLVTNLIRNAEDAMGAGGEIRVSTFARDGKAVLSVTDTGCGMSPEFISESLFKPFATTKSDGFGIGLYQAKKIVEAHQGEIEVESAVGRGTTFRILLPQARE